MYKLSLIAVFLGVLSVSLGQSTSDAPGPFADFAKAITRGGELFRCATLSCDKHAVRKAQQIMCKIVESTKNLPDTSPASLATLSAAVVEGSLAIEPQCDDTTYTCFNGRSKYIPYDLIEVAQGTIHLAAILDGIKAPSQDNLATINQAFVDAVKAVASTNPKGIKCTIEANKALKNVIDTLNSL